MPMGEGTYGSKVGRPKEEKREGMMGGMMPGKHRKKLMVAECNVQQKVLVV
jgi:hypothetical protein